MKKPVRKSVSFFSDFFFTIVLRLRGLPVSRFSEKEARVESTTRTVQTATAEQPHLKRVLICGT